MKTLAIALLPLASVWSRASSYSQMRRPRTKKVAIKALCDRAKQERFARDVDKLIAGVCVDPGVIANFVTGVTTMKRVRLSAFLSVTALSAAGLVSHSAAQQGPSATAPPAS